ncbi:LuxR family transcriptional regulator [Rhizobium sp. ZPR3]|uniref:LuxR family transcriptional regulator n=2 Tax=unclassified Rhizobium TaxID=2613769 RepID=A0AAU7S9P5_9HYPH
MRKRLLELIDSVAASKTRVVLENSFRQFSSSLGIDLFAFTVVAPPYRLDGVSSYPKPWVTRYLAKNYICFDPVVKIARLAQAPFEWSFESLSSTSQEEAQIMREAAEFGIRAGVSVPVKLPYDAFGMLTLAADSATFHLDLEPYLGLLAVAICLGSMVLNSERTAPILSQPINLTKRQVQCLMWASYGKSAKATAAILGISDSAVAFHIKKARQRLQARTISEAIRTAYDMKLLL